MSESELQPFLDDLRGFLHVDSECTWSSLLSVLEGQPFRLNLWHCLALLCSDPDPDNFHVLREGVPLGVGSVIPQCSVMHPPAPPDSVRLPLQRCESAWKSAIDHVMLTLWTSSWQLSLRQAGFVRFRAVMRSFVAPTSTQPWVSCTGAWPSAPSRGGL